MSGISISRQGKPGLSSIQNSAPICLDKDAIKQGAAECIFYIWIHFHTYLVAVPGTQALLRKIQAIVETFDDGDEESKVPDVSNENYSCTHYDFKCTDAWRTKSRNITWRWRWFTIHPKSSMTSNLQDFLTLQKRLIRIRMQRTLQIWKSELCERPIIHCVLGTVLIIVWKNLHIFKSFCLVARSEWNIVQLENHESRVHLHILLSAQRLQRTKRLIWISWSVWGCIRMTKAIILMFCRGSTKTRTWWFAGELMIWLGYFLGLWWRGCSQSTVRSRHIEMKSPRKETFWSQFHRNQYTKYGSGQTDLYSAIESLDTGNSNTIIHPKDEANRPGSRICNVVHWSNLALWF